MPTREERRAKQEQVLRLRERVEARLLEIPGVRAVGVGLKEVEGRLTDEIVLRVYVDAKRAGSEVPADERIPAEIDGVATDVLLWQPTRPVVDSDRYRPLRGGIQIGNGSGSKGTLGCMAQRDSDSSWVALSNHHVMFAGKSLTDTDIKIAQPETGCCCCCVTGWVGEVVGSSIGGLVDCAIATINADAAHIHEIHEIGGVTGTDSAVVGDAVRKRGRSTELTTGTVSDASFPTTSSHGIAFTNQLKIAPDTGFDDFVIGGDSGSALVDADEALVVGLIWGQNGHDGVANRISDVESALGITIPAVSGTGTASTFDRRAASAAPAGGGRVRDWERLLFDELEADHPLSALVRRHRAEVWDLIQHNREVGVRWQRGQGPAFVAAFQRTTHKVGYRVPKEIDDVSFAQLLLVMAAALERNGSATLREDLRSEALAWIPRLQNCDTADALWREYQILSHELGR